jgi:ribosomal protein S18 acetylase RimI-like enzyme
MKIVEKILRLRKIKKIKDKDNMKPGFWSNKPVQISIDGNYTNIYNKEDILSKVNKEIEENRFKLKYHVLDGNDLTSNKIHEIVEFINMNYVESTRDSFKLIYTDELFSFYCKDSIILEFYPVSTNATKIVGYVVGKKSKISLYHSIFDSSEVNFLCIIPTLRSLGLGSYMLNVLTKEIILKYNVTTSHYTISAPIKSPYFGEKKFYHRFINAHNLHKIKFISKMYNSYNIFNYDKDCNYILEYINGHGINDELGKSLYDKYIFYCKNTYDIYDVVDYEEFNKSFSNNIFHHFIIYSESSEVVSYVSLFRLDTFNNNMKMGVKTGYYYYMFFDDKSKIANDLEYINKYIYDNCIFDILTFTDIFDVDYESMNYIKGSSLLRYYFYNLNIPLINNKKNGMITI